MSHWMISEISAALIFTCLSLHAEPPQANPEPYRLVVSDCREAQEIKVVATPKLLCDEPGCKLAFQVSVSSWRKLAYNKLEKRDNCVYGEMTDSGKSRSPEDFQKELLKLLVQSGIAVDKIDISPIREHVSFNEKGYFGSQQILVEKDETIAFSELWRLVVSVDIFQYVKKAGETKESIKKIGSIAVPTNSMASSSFAIVKKTEPTSQK